MPYLKDEGRAAALYDANRADPEDLPELTYVLCDTLDKYVSRDFNASTMEEAFGAMVGALLDFNRRVVAPYEARKQAEVDPGFDPWGFCQGRLDGSDAERAAQEAFDRMQAERGLAP